MIIVVIESRWEDLTDTHKVPSMATRAIDVTRVSIHDDICDIGYL